MTIKERIGYEGCESIPLPLAALVYFIGFCIRCFGLYVCLPMGALMCLILSAQLALDAMGLSLNRV